MKKLALFICLTIVIAFSCEDNDAKKDNVILTPNYEYINKLVRIEDTLWVISSKPSPFMDFVYTPPPTEISKINLSDNNILSSREIPPCVTMAVSKNGQAFLATVDRKILKLNQDLSTIQLFTIPRFNIRMLCCDKNNNLWIATYDGGIYFYDGMDTLRFSSSNSILNNNWIASITLDSESNVWLIQGMDLFKIDKNRIISKDPYQLSIDKPTGVFDLSADNQNTLFGSKWDGNYHRLLKKELGSPWTIINPPNSANDRPVKFIKSDNDGTIWICYSEYPPKDNLAYFANNNWVEIEIPFSNINILDIETYNDKIILGSSKGIRTMTK